MTPKGQFTHSTPRPCAMIGMQGERGLSRAFYCLGALLSAACHRGDFSWQEEVLAGSMECVLGVLLLPWDPCQIKGTDATAFYVTDPRSGLPGRTGLWAGTGPLLRWPSVLPLPPSPDKPHREECWRNSVSKSCCLCLHSAFEN